MQEPAVSTPPMEDIAEIRVTSAMLHVVLEDRTERTFAVPVQAIASHSHCPDYRKHHPPGDDHPRSVACIKVAGQWVCL
jgi:hypothetical protein